VETLVDEIVEAHMTPEGAVKAKVKEALNELKSYWFMPVQTIYSAHALDFYCCINGVFVAIETKAPKKMLSVRQVALARVIAASGGLVCVIRDEVDIQIMRTMLKNYWTGTVQDLLGSKEIYGELWCK
jgi:hypothetical protein